MASQSKSDELHDLARERFSDTWTVADETLFRAIGSGIVADFSRKSKDENDPANAGQWTAERVLSADRIAWLCKDRRALSHVSCAGIQVAGARIDGALELRWVKLPFPFRLVLCAISEQLTLANADIAFVSLDASHIKSLNADNIRVAGAVYLRAGFKAVGEVNLKGADIGGDLECWGGSFSYPSGIAFNADRMRVAGGVFLSSGFKAQGVVRLVDATIGGQITCSGGVFSNRDGYALVADGVRVGQSVMLRDGFSAEGGVKMVAATIGGNIECDAGSFHNPGGIAFGTDGMKVTRSVFLRGGFKAVGEVRMVDGDIGGQLDCCGGIFKNPDGTALYADKLRVEGSVYLRDGFSAEGRLSIVDADIGGHFQMRGIAAPGSATLDLDSASIGTLYDEKESWPNTLSLSGLQYEKIALDSPRDVTRRLEWLGRQKHFDPQPYQQLAKVLRSMGDEDQARLILISKEKHRRRLGSLRWWQRGWNCLQWLAWDYGYRPHKAFQRWALVLIALGSFLFWRGYEAGAIWPTVGPYDDATSVQVSHAYPKFHPVMYSVDSFVPIIDLHQQAYWLPAADAQVVPGRWSLPGNLLRAYHWLHICFGWLLCFWFVAGLSGLVRKE